MFSPDKKVFNFLGISIWHCDPCVDGTDDSCGYSKPKLYTKEKSFLHSLIDNEYDNLRLFFGNKQIHIINGKEFVEDIDLDEMKRRLRIIVRNYKKFKQKWWQHPKYHFWHWRIYFNFFKKRLSFGAKSKEVSFMESIDW